MSRPRFGEVYEWQGPGDNGTLVMVVCATAADEFRAVRILLPTAPRRSKERDMALLTCHTHGQWKWRRVR
jgi:NAD(P)H-hydrate repair Nnr-like enzyme with NAD(P)H-hydrate epimerase domain